MIGNLYWKCVSRHICSLICEKAYIGRRKLNEHRRRLVMIWKKRKSNANHFFFIYFLSSNRGPSQGKMTTLKFPEHLKRLKKHYSLMQYKGHNSMRWPFYNHFWPFFCQLHKYLSQNLGADSHFEGLNVSKSQLNQNLRHKLQMVLTSLFFNFGRKKFKDKCFKNGHFLTICGHFLATT